MTSEERVESLHVRMAALRRVRERRKIRFLGASGAALALCLVLLIFGEGAVHTCGTAGLYSGSMMLFEGVGAYVLVAIIAFMMGVIVTVVLKGYRKKGTGQTSKDREDKRAEDEEDGSHRDGGIRQRRQS